MSHSHTRTYAYGHAVCGVVLRSVLREGRGTNTNARQVVGMLPDNNMCMVRVFVCMCVF